MNEFVEKLSERLKSEVNYNDGAEIGSRQAIEIVKDLVSEHNNGWIPCSERLPEDRQNVLIIDSNGKIRLIAFNKWLYENPQYSHNIIPIEWQPLPELPAPYKKEE